MADVALTRRARQLSWFTVVYNLVEGGISVAFGALSGSAALIGFGFDSFVESLSGGVMIWRFHDRGELSAERREQLEARALKLVGYTFYLLAAYVFYEAAESLIFAQVPERSAAGIVIAIVSLIVMPLLYVAKRRTGKKLGSRSLTADANQTLACMFLSVALLVGVGLNYLFGLWQADPVAGLVIAAFLVKEGHEAIEHGKLCNC